LRVDATPVIGDGYVPTIGDPSRAGTTLFISDESHCELLRVSSGIFIGQQWPDGPSDRG